MRSAGLRPGFIAPAFNRAFGSGRSDSDSNGERSDKNLSKGEYAKVGLALALAPDPRSADPRRADLRARRASSAASFWTAW